ncbi:MAG: hypothetical protein ACLVBP_18950 [Ruminococcus sp.]
MGVQKCFKDHFGTVEKEVLEVGSPCVTDIFLVDDELKLCIRKKLICQTNLLLCMHLRFRQTISFDVFNNNYEKWISAFEKKRLVGSVNCFLRLHPNIASFYIKIFKLEKIL